MSRQTLRRSQPRALSSCLNLRSELESQDWTTSSWLKSSELFTQTACIRHHSRAALTIQTYGIISLTQSGSLRGVLQLCVLAYRADRDHLRDINVRCCNVGLIHCLPAEDLDIQAYLLYILLQGASQRVTAVFHMLYFRYYNSTFYLFLKAVT